MRACVRAARARTHWPGGAGHLQELIVVRGRQLVHVIRHNAWAHLVGICCLSRPDREQGGHGEAHPATHAQRAQGDCALAITRPPYHQHSRPRSWHRVVPSDPNGIDLEWPRLINAHLPLQHGLNSLPLECCEQVCHVITGDQFGTQLLISKNIDVDWVHQINKTSIHEIWEPISKRIGCSWRRTLGSDTGRSASRRSS